MRIVIERSGTAVGAPPPIPVDDVEWCQRRIAELAKADPPYLMEEPLTLTANDPEPQPDGSIRYSYRVHAVMNTEKGWKLAPFVIQDWPVGPFVKFAPGRFGFKDPS